MKLTYRQQLKRALAADSKRDIAFAPTSWEEMAMTMINLKSRSIEVLADDYARTRQKRSRAISVAAVIRAIRTLVPEGDFTDEELTNIVAAAAIRYGHSVDFDVERPRNTQRPPEAETMIGTEASPQSRD